MYKNNVEVYLFKLLKTDQRQCRHFFYLFIYFSTYTKSSQFFINWNFFPIIVKINLITPNTYFPNQTNA